MTTAATQASRSTGAIRSDNLIGGQWVQANSRQRIAVTNPATDELIAEVPDGAADEAQRAIDAAADALPDWMNRPAAERSRLMRRLSDLMHEQQDRLAELMTREGGKPITEAKGEVRYAASFIEWAAEEGKRVYGETIPSSSTDKRIMVLRQPIGVTAAITPWNFPAAMITRKLGPALACGCTMIVKPAEQTPLTAIALGELAQEAGIPGGVVNIITGDAKTIAETLLDSFTVRAMSFTGSTEVGRSLLKGSAKHITRLSLELGGHAPIIVFDDADVDKAVEGAVGSKFRNAGQTCICANRFYIHDAVYDAFVERFQRAVKQLPVGNPLDESVRIGPLIDDDGVAKVDKHVGDALARGATVRCGGERVSIDGLSDRFYAPTILENVTRDMLVSNEETFGPVAPMQRFTDEHDVIQRANDTAYGLAGYFYTRDSARLLRVAEALEYGIVGANDALPSVAQAPFGGMKQSGIGREGGKYAMDEFLETKYVSIGV